MEELLPDITENLSTDVTLACLAVAHQAVARGQHRHAESAENSRHPVAARVDPQAGLGDPPDTRDRPLAVAVVLEGDLELVAGTLAGGLDLEARDVSLLLEYDCEGFLQ